MFYDFLWSDPTGSGFRSATLLAAAVAVAHSKLTVRLLRADLTPTADKFSSKIPFQVIFSTYNNSSTP